MYPYAIFVTYTDDCKLVFLGFLACRPLFRFRILLGPNSARPLCLIRIISFER